jgi:hypothetical protein
MAKLLVADAALPVVAALRGTSAAVVLMAALGWRQGWKALVLCRGRTWRASSCSASWASASARSPGCTR